MTHATGEVLFWLCLLLSIIGSLLPHFMYHVIFLNFHPTFRNFAWRTSAKKLQRISDFFPLNDQTLTLSPPLRSGSTTPTLSSRHMSMHILAGATNPFPQGENTTLPSLSSAHPPWPPVEWILPTSEYHPFLFPPLNQGSPPDALCGAASPMSSHPQTDDLVAPTPISTPTSILNNQLQVATITTQPSSSVSHEINSTPPLKKLSAVKSKALKKR
jgi:hypothetical protein